MKYFPRWLPALLSVALILLMGSLFTSTGRDDTHITVWAAYSLAHIGSIVNYNGARVEQSSSLLQVLVLAALARLNLININDLARLTSIFFAIATALAVYWLARKMIPATQPYSAYGALLLVGTSVYLVYWAYSGMETTLVALAVLLVILLCGNFLETPNPNRATVAAAILSIVIFITIRPETPLLLGAVLFVLLVLECSRIAWLMALDATRFRRLLFLGGVFALSFAALLLFRLWYFGKLFPQPVYAKVGGVSLAVLLDGLTYLYIHLRLEPLVGIEFGLGIIGAVYLLWQARRKRYVLTTYFWFALFLVAVQLGFIVFTGGDWMEAARFLVPILPLGILLMVVTTMQLIKTPRTQIIIWGVFVFLQLLTLVDYARFYSGGMPIWSQIPLPQQFTANEYSWFEQRNRVNVRDMPLLYVLEPIVAQLSRTETRPLILMSGQMGMVPFHLVTQPNGRLELIDRFGLTDATFTNCEFVRKHPDPTLDWGVSWQYIFANAATLMNECAIPLPDVIYDVGDESDMNTLTENNYEILYKQSGLVSSTANFLHGRPIEAGEFIAVRQDLARNVKVELSQFIFGN